MYRGPTGVTRHRLSTYIGEVKSNLVREQVRQLTADLVPYRADEIKGRKSTYLFATMAQPIPPTWGGIPVYSEGQKTQGMAPFARQCIDRIRYGDMATPVNPIHNYRQHYAMVHAGALRRQAHHKKKPLVTRATCPLELRPLPKPKRTASYWQRRNDLLWQTRPFLFPPTAPRVAFTSRTPTTSRSSALRHSRSAPTYSAPSPTHRRPID